MKIVFVANQCVPFHGRSLEERPLGGTETAVIRLSELLHARGHAVTVFTPHENPAESGPCYIPLSDASLERMPICDVLVAVRDWKVLLSPAHADLRLFWTGDSYDVPPTFGIGDLRVERRIDGLLINGAWHARELCGRSGFPVEKAWAIGCGVHLPHFEGAEPRVRKQLIYSSAPVRGLALLPSIYARVKALHPDASLRIHAGFGTYAGGPGGDHPQWAAEWGALAETLAALPDCTLCGNVSQQELARAFMRSSVLAYPNTFNETFCITAAEAQAAGCAIVTSDRAALPETVGGGGMLISGLPGSRQYEDDFVEAVDCLLRDDALWQGHSDAGRARARTVFGWETLTDRFEQYVAQSLERKRAAGGVRRAVLAP